MGSIQSFRHPVSSSAAEDSQRILFFIAGTPPRGARDSSFVVIASDGFGESRQRVQVKILSINTAPRLVSPQRVKAITDTQFFYTARAVDDEKDALTYTFKNFPDWLIPADSTISGTTPASEQTASFIVIVNDAEFSDTMKVQIQISRANLPPKITSTDSVVAIEDSLFTYVAQATDPEQDPLRFHFKHYPHWLHPTDSALVGIPREGQTDSSFWVIATDGLKSDSLQVTIHYIAVNDPPRIINLTNFVIPEQGLYSINLAHCVKDDGHAPKNMWWQMTAFDARLTIFLDEYNAQFTAKDGLDSTRVKFKVSDPAGASDSLVVKVRVEHSADVIQQTTAIPQNYYLGQNFPNPFNPETTISFGLPVDGFVSVQVFDVQGRLIADLFTGKKSAGNHQLVWQAAEQSSGLYFIKMSTDQAVWTRKCVLIK